MTDNKSSTKTGIPTNVLPLPATPREQVLINAVIKEALLETGNVRQKALANAKSALEEAFAPRFKEMLAEKFKEEATKNSTKTFDSLGNPMDTIEIEGKSVPISNVHIPENEVIRVLPTNVLPLSSTPSESVWNAAVADAKQVRQKALANAKTTLEEAFSTEEKWQEFKKSNKEDMKEFTNVMSASLNEIKSVDLNDLAPVYNTSKEYQDEFRRNIKRKQEETKKVIQSFHKNMATYPKYISHEGSTVLCVLLSMEPHPSIRMEGIPASDRDILRHSIPDTTLLEADFDDIRVEFDEQKDFIVTFLEKDVVLHTIRLFNTVIHPQNIHVPTSVVDVEDGDKISIGGKVVMDKNAVKKLIGFKPELPSKKEEEKEEPRRQQVVGRNAFEIREDIIECSIDLVKFSSLTGKRDISSLTDEVLKTASKLYEFVENKRYNRH